MYSFDGEFRRKPQQNLAGVCRKQERNELLQRAQIQRLKREEQRKRQNSTIVVQALVRSFLTRIAHKRNQRAIFDDIVHRLNGQHPDDGTLTSLIQKLLFFYCNKNDVNRLIWISQICLKKYDQFLKASERSNSDWSWRIRRLLHLCVMFMSSSSDKSNRESLAIPLRMVEVFTSWETSKQVLGNEKAGVYLTNLFTFLVRKGYFKHVRAIIDSRIPPLLEVSVQPPTPLSGCLFDMISRPIQHVSNTSDKDFGYLIMKELCRHILSPKPSEPLQMYIIPSLSEMTHFPFLELLESIGPTGSESDILPTSWLLFSVLSLERKHFVLDEFGKSNQLLIYLQIMSQLTVNISKLSDDQGSDSNSDDDSDTEFEEKASNSEEVRILEQCVEMFNDLSRVHNLLIAVDQSQDPRILQALCQVCHNLLVAHKFAIHKYKLLYMLAFKPSFLCHLWGAISSVCQTSLFGNPTPLLQVISRGIPMSPDVGQRIVPLLAVFCSLFSLLIVTLHDAEFYADESDLGGTLRTMPFSLSELVPLSLTLKEVCLGLVELAFPDSRPVVRDDYRTAVHGKDRPLVDIKETQMWAHLFKATVGLLRQLHARDIRRSFCPEGHWISKQVVIPLDKPSDFSIRRHRLRSYRPFQGLRVFTREELEEGPPLSTKEVRWMTILREVPFLVPFQDRVLVFQNLVFHDKMEHQGERTHFLQGPSIQIFIRRNYLYEDAFDKLSLENEPELRLKMRVQLVNVAGMDEAGVDGGGLFREFLSELLKTAFDPNRGFFRLTKDNLLYPNPNVHLIIENFPKHYFFIGRMMGKALYENLLVELPFAEFFLMKLVGRHSSVDVHHLDSLDPVLHRNLLFLKSYEGDVADLGLDFTVLNDELGETRVDELKSGGANINVTSSNRIEYIHLMADYKLNRQIHAQCAAFKQGLANVLPVEWLQMFNSKEVQVLISGAEIPVDVDDLKEHSNYAGGYAADHHTIQIFWKVVENFTDVQRRQLLKFVTSCSRPPLLGFKELDPPFCIQHAGSIDRLPTASTCMNLLKLPEFPNETLLKEKLLYAIQAGAGFELS